MGTSVLELLSKVKLEDAERELQEAEAEFERIVGEQKKKVDALREAVKLVRIRDNGKPKRTINRKKKGEAADGTGEVEPDNRAKIIAYRQAAGPATAGAISRGTGIAVNVVSRLGNSTPAIKADPKTQTYELKRGV